MTRKWEFTGETKSWCDITLRRIRALVDIGASVKAGDVGGWLEADAALSQDGDAWVFGNAQVSGDAQVFGNAQVSGNAQVFGNAQVSGNARVYGNAWVSGDARCLLTIGPIGSRCAMLTIHADFKIGVRFNAGCFTGTRDEFLAQVEKTHGDNKHGNAYAAAVMLADHLVDAPVGEALKEAA